jgi:hypothetical protein
MQCWAWLRSVPTVSAVGVAVLAACNSPGPCFGLGVGTKLGITIVDYYPGNPNYPQDQRAAGGPDVSTCVFGFDVAQGQELLATVASTSDADTCEVAVPAFQPFGAWSWTDGRQNAGGSFYAFDGQYTASSSYCDGQVAVGARVASGNQNVFQPPVVGQVPPVVMERIFTSSQSLGDASASMCPASCIGIFVVGLRRLN